MAKSADAFRTISEVADWLGVPTHVLRFWESKFPQVKPVKRAGGRRYYRPSDMVLLAGIRVLLHDDGVTIRGVQKVLREKGVKHVSGLADRDIGDDGETMSEGRGPRTAPLQEPDSDTPEAPEAETVQVPEEATFSRDQTETENTGTPQPEDQTLFDSVPKDAPAEAEPAVAEEPTSSPDPEPEPDEPEPEPDLDRTPDPEAQTAALPDLPGPSPSGAAALKPLLAQLAHADPDAAADIRAALKANVDALTALRDRMADAPKTSGSGTDA
jgi:DNA-binding transcriptional MerR regulator